MRPTVLLFLLLVGTAIVLPIIKEESRTFQLSEGSTVDLNLKFADSIYIKAIDGNALKFHAMLKSTDEELKAAHTIDYEQKRDLLKIESNIPDQFWQAKNEAEKQFDYRSNLIVYTVEVPKSAKLKVETISGNIEIRNFSGDVKAKSISGFVDLDWAEQPADIHMSSITGEVYTDINVDFSTPIKEMPIVGYPLKGTIKKGGAELHLESVSNNIYFRKR